MFKTCPLCKTRWDTRSDFLADPSLKIIGYQVNFNHLSAGLFLFNHSCNTTLAIQAGELFDLYDGPIFTDRKTGGPECPAYCLHESVLHRCPAKCECASVREVIQIIKNKQFNTD
jgi:hypothetical protein